MTYAFITGCSTREKFSRWLSSNNFSMKKLAGVILICTLFFLLNGGCKKKNDSKLECRIVRLTKKTQTFDFSYGSNGKVSAMLLMPDNQQTLFSYEGNKTI